MLGGLWLAVTSVLAGKELSAVRADLVRVNRSLDLGQIEHAREIAATIPSRAHRAELMTSGPAWWLAGQVPWLGDPFKVTRGVTVSANRLGTTTLPVLVRLSSDLSPENLRVTTDSINLPAIEQAGPDVSRSARNIHRALDELSVLPHGTWVSQVNQGRTDLEAELRRIGGLLDAVDQAARALPGMAGGHGTRRYFLAMENEAEMRGTGGLPGAFAIAELTDGKLKFTRFSSDRPLLPNATGQLVDTGIDFGDEYQFLYGQARPTANYQNSNISPYFPQAAQVWASMWQKVSGEHIDGSIALDPTTLSYFLAAMGPVKLSDGTLLTAANVVPLTQKDLYAKFSDQNQRKDYLVDILRAVDTRLLTSPRTVPLMNAYARAARERRLMIWTSHADDQKVLEEARIAGVLAAPNQPYTGLVLNNLVGGKLDYYLDRSLSYQRNDCGNLRSAVVRITVTNNAPASGLPPYVTARLDRPTASTKPGDTRTQLDYYATGGAELVDATLNGEKVLLGSYRAYGLSIYRLDLELPRGKTQTLVIHLLEPAGKGKPKALVQPGVRPLALQVSDYC